MPNLQLLLVSSLVIMYVSAKQAIVVNYCSETIWPALHGRNHHNNELSFINFTTPPLEGVLPNKTFAFQLPDESFSARLWGRTKCKSIPANASSSSVEMFSCRDGTGDCGNLKCYDRTSSNTTLVEWDVTNGTIYYDISLVDRMTKPLKMSLPSTDCKTLGCTRRLNDLECPDLNRWCDPSGHSLLGCKSNCSVHNSPELCCTGQYSTADNCTADGNPLFANVCPDAYSYAFSETHRPSILQKCDRFEGILIEFCPTK